MSQMAFYSNKTNGTISFFHFGYSQPIKPAVWIIGGTFFAYFTPVVIVVGLVGNSLSLAVFTSKSLRKLSASSYLAALSMADISSLIFYVLIEWLRRGMEYIHPNAHIYFLDRNGICQFLLFMAYLSRMMSVWIIVVFTIERFTGICYPLRSFKRGALKIVLIILGVSSLLLLYKPILSGQYTIGTKTACSSNPKYKALSYSLDIAFATSITMVPFIIITILNFLIVRKLFIRNKESKNLFSEESKIRLEFTLILLLISFFFILFNLPYSVIFMIHFNQTSDIEYWNGVLMITRTIFYMNYSSSFFLYSITGKYFRRALLNMICCRSARKHQLGSYIRCRRLGSSNTHMTVCSRASGSLLSRNEAAI